MPTMIQVKTNKISHSRIEIEGELESSAFEAYYQKALKKISEHVELPGFRKGHVPEDVLKTKVPEVQILDEMAEMAISEAYPKILEQEKIDAIGRPEVTITKIAIGNPLGFKITTDVLPDIELSTYASIAKNIAKGSDPVITDEDVEKTVLEIRKMRAKMEANKNSSSSTDGHDHSDPNSAPADGHVHTESEVKEEDLPIFDDAFAQSLGGFTSVDDLKSKIRENMTLEKGNEAREKHRLAIMEALIKEANIEPPEALIEGELNKMAFRFEGDLSQMGYKLDDYLKQLGKTKEEIMKEWRPDAEKRVRVELIIRHIAISEKLEPSNEEVEPEVKKLLEQYKGADPLRTRLYVEQMLISEKVFNFLEGQNK